MTVIPSELSKREKFYFHYARDLKSIADGDIFIKPVQRANGRIVISIELGENTTARQLRDAEPLAMQWRDRLNEFQGRVLVEHNPIFNEIQRLADSGLIYAEIARRVNKKISELLRDYSELPNKDTFTARTLLCDAREILATLYVVDELAKRRGRYGKAEKKCAREWVDSVIDNALKQIAKGEKPFDAADYPLSGNGVRYVVAQWRRKKTA